MCNLIDCNSPIGIFDSGIGGINVLHRAKKLMPSENFIYLGDNGNTPYGNKKIDQLKRLSLTSIETLTALNCKAICVACNTLSTSVLDYIKEVSSVPIIPTLPINIAGDNQNATLMATPNTINSDYVKTNFQGVNLLPLPFLAREIEQSPFDLSKVNVRLDVKGVKEGSDLIILGCTHYSFVKNEIERLSKVKTVDTLDHTANLIRQTVDNLGLLNKNGGKITFIGDFKRYNRRVYKYLKTLKWA